MGHPLGSTRPFSVAPLPLTLDPGSVIVSGLGALPATQLTVTGDATATGADTANAAIARRMIRDASFLTTPPLLWIRRQPP